jgi:hypothetical protein
MEDRAAGQSVLIGNALKRSAKAVNLRLSKLRPGCGQLVDGNIANKPSADIVKSGGGRSFLRWFSEGDVRRRSSSSKIITHKMRKAPICRFPSAQFDHAVEAPPDVPWPPADNKVPTGPGLKSNRLVGTFK